MVIPVVPVASDPKHPWVLILIPVITGIIEHIRIESELMHKKTFRNFTNYEIL